MQDVAITGFGSYLPHLKHTNATLPALDKPITEAEIERIGVFSRHWADDTEEPIPVMAYGAAQKAIERAGVDPSRFDLIVLANWTQRRYIPEHAPKLQALLGADDAFAFDVSGACTGFINGLGIAHSFMQNPRYKQALVVAAETTSKRARPHSKGSLILGDAAGAFVLERGASKGGRLIDWELHTNGKQHHIMDVSPEGWVRTHIPQRELNQLAGHSMQQVARAVLQRNNMTLDDVDWVIPHSGTAGVQAVVSQALEVPPEKLLSNYATIGNVSSASIPAALDQFVAEGKVKPGDLILSAAVGTGWYYSAMLYTL